MIDPMKAGYYTGYFGTKLFVYVSSARLSIRGFNFLNTFAKSHRIDSKSQESVTNNLLDCLEYLDW